MIVDGCLSPTTAATGAAKRKKRNKSKKAAAPAATTSAAPAVATAGVDDDAVARRNTLKELVSESLAGLELQHAASTEKKIFTEELCQSATKKVGKNLYARSLFRPILNDFAIVFQSNKVIPTRNYCRVCFPAVIR